MTNNSSFIALSSVKLSLITSLHVQGISPNLHQFLCCSWKKFVIRFSAGSVGNPGAGGAGGAGGLPPPLTRAGNFEVGVICMLLFTRFHQI